MDGSEVVISLKRGFRNFFGSLRDSDEDGGSIESYAGHLQKVVAEVMDLVQAGLALVYWHWSGDDITLVYKLPESHLHYCEAAQRAHVKLVFDRIKSVYIPGVGKELIRRCRESGYRLTEKDILRMESSIDIRGVTKVVTPQEPGHIVVQFKTGQWAGKGRVGPNSEPEPAEAIGELELGNNDADFVCTYTFACN